MIWSLMFSGILLASLLVFFVRKTYKFHYTLFLLVLAVALTTHWSLKAFAAEAGVLTISLLPPVFQHNFILIADRLSAFFIIVINITVLSGFLYSRGYLRRYQDAKTPLQFSVHYFSYLWLCFSMIMVVMIRDGFFFLVAWEIMALSSFMLVIFDAEERSIMKTGIGYLIQMHSGMFFILAAFLIVFKATGEMSFDAVRLYFAGHPNIPVFLLFFTGFGIKAGFIPLHTWLPEAHPAAPSHVSGVMSGVMIKMGIYAILRVIVQVQDDLLSIGVLILVVSLISGVMGVMMAIVQHDMKRLLAYHSIENIGIIGIGIGLGTIGLATGIMPLVVFGFSGGLLHVLNHSLFKSLLFYNAGSVYLATHTRNIEQLGGLSKKMPLTTLLFLTGSLAICGLPPFNGFVSEFLIYLGMFKSLPSADLGQSILILSSIVGLSMIGGLAIFCFTKAFGIVFLGTPRTQEAGNAGEVNIGMILPQLIPVAFILLIGLVPVFFVKPVISVVAGSFNLPVITPEFAPVLKNLPMISVAGGVFVVLVTLLLVYRHMYMKTKKIETGSTWGCGYTAITSRHQYTATSYAYNYNHLAKPVINTSKAMEDIREDEIFPAKRSFHSHSEDFFRKYLVDMPVDLLSSGLKKLAVMQTGRIQHYILYAFVFMLVVFILTFFNLI